MKIPFSKYQGAGNDFILVDNRKGIFSCADKKAIAQLCDRRFGVGADGVLLLEESSIADYKMRIFNSDGSEPSMCGNGMRCLIDFLYRSEKKHHYAIEIAGRTLHARHMEDQIAVNMGQPTPLHFSEEVKAYVLNTGVPHAVLFVEELASIPFLELAQQIRFHPAFAPEGVNVNFASFTAGNSIQLRTYERGVEAETLACGTGAAATAWVARHVHSLKGEVTIKTRTDSLSFRFSEKNEIEMIGSATLVFIGEIILNEAYRT